MNTKFTRKNKRWCISQERRQRAQVQIIWGPEVILENRALSYLQGEPWYQQGLQSYTL